MGKSRRPADRNAKAPRTRIAHRGRRILLSGFAPFGGERSNPSWEVAAALDKRIIGGLAVESIRLPVNTARAVKQINAEIRRRQPDAILGLGQAGSRPAISLEKVAINLIERRSRRETDGGLSGAAIVAGGPDGYFARIPFKEILRALNRRGIPATLSLSAGAYVCNSVMYAVLHAMRSRTAVPAGFIHLPYDARQAVRHRNAPSMTVEMMTAAVEAAVAEIARRMPASTT